MSFQTLPTTKGKDSILVNNFRYYLWRENKNSKYWVCSREKCLASITTQGEILLKVSGKRVEVEDIGQIVKESHYQHDSLSEEEISFLKALNTMKIRARDTGSDVGDIYREEHTKFIKEFGNLEIAANNFRPLYCVKTSLYRARNARYPPLMESISDIDLADSRFCKIIFKIKIF